jgi:hypothetical protein
MHHCDVANQSNSEQIVPTVFRNCAPISGGWQLTIRLTSFGATGITNFLENDGTLEAAQRIAGHADSRTTKLYDRSGQKVLLEDTERIRY